VRTGLGGVISTDPEMFASMCEAAAIARMRGDMPSVFEVGCPHLAALSITDSAGNDEHEGCSPADRTTVA
jgi:hypothetical protein